MSFFAERFEKICQDLENQSWSVIDDALDLSLQQSLWQSCQQKWQQERFVEAHIGRGPQLLRREELRGDLICWLDPTETALQEFWQWITQLQEQLNQRYYLGLKSNEFHFARYPEGRGYTKHWDQHRDSTQRKISMVYYLNPTWGANEGGELCLYSAENENQLQTKVLPSGGRLVLFRSDQIPHEVRPALKPRWSLTGWLRT